MQLLSFLIFLLSSVVVMTYICWSLSLAQVDFLKIFVSLILSCLLLCDRHVLTNCMAKLLAIYVVCY
jgi:hypothetical protein